MDEFKIKRVFNLVHPQEEWGYYGYYWELKIIHKSGKYSFNMKTEIHYPNEQFIPKIFD